MRTTRRNLLRLGALGGAGALLVPVRRALAADTGSTSHLKVLFVVNYGGWDPTRVFASEFGNAAVDMEREAEVGQVGGVSFVDHPDRPSVRTFFERHHARSLVINGVLVPSIAHENCLKLQMTGTTSDGASDWPAILAAQAADRYPIPHLVVAGPSFPGDLGGVVSRTGSSGQLAGLLDGSILSWSDVPTRAAGARAEAVMDRYLQRRAAAVTDAARFARDLELATAYEGALDQALSLKALDGVMDFGSAASFAAQARLAVDALGEGVSRCATVSYSLYGWDTHVANDLYQSANFEGLFGELLALLDRLAERPGEVSPTLADETLVVVLSEMGRTPKLNDGEGKDHWPYTSVLMVGPAISGDRVVGGFDPLYYGEPVDPASGEVSDAGSLLSSAALGASLLELFDIDPDAFLTGTDALPGVLRP